MLGLPMNILIRQDNLTTNTNNGLVDDHLLTFMLPIHYEVQCPVIAVAVIAMQ